MTTEEMTYAKAALMAKRDELNAAIRAATSHLTLGAAEADLLERVQSMCARDQQALMLNRLSETLDEVERSLDAISDGSYGICPICDEPIAPKRLRTIPWAALCVRCQERIEARSKFAPPSAFDSADPRFQSAA